MRDDRHDSAAAPRRLRPTGFTLVQLLMVIGIIALLAGMLLPVVGRARRQASRARTANDLQAMAAGLQAYHDIWNAYPVLDLPLATANLYVEHDSLDTLVGGNPPTYVPYVNDNGAHTLFTSLALRCQLRPGGAPYGPLLNLENFKVTRIDTLINTPVGYPIRKKAGRFLDGNDQPYVYVPGNPSLPDITAPGSSLFVASPPLTSVRQPLYSHRAFPGGTLSTTKEMQRILGDEDMSGNINGNERPAYTGPFLLWAAGPDGLWGLKPHGDNTDDVTNFEIPPNLRR